MPSILVQLPDTLEPVEPAAALDYFKSLVRRLGVDPLRWLPSMRRRAFTLCAAIEHTLLKNAHDAIRETLIGNIGTEELPRVIDDLVEQLGVAPNNPQYSSMVARTNVMDALVTGAQDEAQSSPEMEQAFPVWEYMGIDDGREGKDHRPNFGHFFPAAMPFQLVRGKRVYNCRCGPRFVAAAEWRSLLDSGSVLTTVIPREQAGYP